MADAPTSLAYRGDTYRAQARYEDAWNDYDTSVKITTRLLEQEKRGDLACDLADSLSNRGKTCRLQGRYDEAIGDFTNAEKIYSRLVERTPERTGL